MLLLLIHCDGHCSKASKSDVLLSLLGESKLLLEKKAFRLELRLRC